MSATSFTVSNPLDVRAAPEARARGVENQNQAVLGRARREGVFGLGESYIRGEWSVHRLDEVLYGVFTAPPTRRSARHRLQRLGAIVLDRLLNRQAGRGAFDIGRAHYDLGDPLFRAMLDESMTYTCGVWAGASTLGGAQRAKLELICRKLRLRPGLHVLDIGCGWGNFARYAAERFGVRVTGITVSARQADTARERCRGLPVDIRLQDYRELNETFDRVVSVEMIEAVGRRNLGAFYRVVDRCLSDEGVFVLQAISADTLSRTSHPALDDLVLWLLKHIFPRGYLPAQHELVAPRDTSLLIEGWQSFGPDYDRTLGAWAANFNGAWDQLRDQYGDAFRRRWNFYLHACMAAFRARLIDVHQIVYARGGGRHRGRSAPANTGDGRHRGGAST
ncbi:MAG: cyclopropane fatty acyl phospholipid synthase [Phycisphaerales bacterium]